MRVVVVGSGAVGSFIAWAAARGGLDVTLVRRRHAGPRHRTRLEAERPDGSIDAVELEVAADVAAAADTDEAVLIVLAVKQPDLAGALAAIEGLPDAAVLTIQNGVGAEDVVRAARPAAPLLAGSLTAAVELTDTGRVRWLRRGGLGLAPVVTGGGPLWATFQGAVEAAGLPTRVQRDPAAMKWSKLLANLVANAISAILDLDPAAIYRDPLAFELEREQLREAVAVMEAQAVRPIDLPGARVRLLLLGLRLPAPLARPVLARVIGGARGGKAPSLRLSIHRDDGSDGTVRSEAEWLNGAVARAGARFGLATPVNEGLARIVAELEAAPARRAWYRGRPDRLVAAIRGEAHPDDPDDPPSA